MDEGLDSAILEVVAAHYLNIGERHLSSMQIHSAIRWRWPWLTDPLDTGEVVAAAHALAEGGLLDERLPRSGLDLFTDYRITEAGHACLRDHPPPHPCQPPQGAVKELSAEWTCPDCGAVFRPRLRLEQVMFHEQSTASPQPKWDKVRDGDSVNASYRPTGSPT